MIAHTNRGRLSVDLDADWRVYSPRVPPTARVLGVVDRGGDRGVLVVFACTGKYAQINAGAVRYLPQTKAIAALRDARKGRRGGRMGGGQVTSDGTDVRRRCVMLDDESVDTSLTIGPASRKPLVLDIPLFVSDMSFGALSSESKTALARGAELSGTAIASGEGGILPAEKAESTRYLYELASARFGFTWEKLSDVQAFHFKGGQAAKTGTGGHLPGPKVTAEIAGVRNIPVGEHAVSPSRFPEWTKPGDFAEFATEVRERTGGIPIGFKLSAQHVETDLDAALEVGVDYVILDGRGGGTGAAPLLFRDNISVPTITALARARRFLDEAHAPNVTLIITGGLRTPADFVKALALGADGIAVSNVALQAIGCIGMRACNTNNCPVGIATQQPHLRSRLPVDEAAHRLARYFGAATDLMTVLARACGHRTLGEFMVEDLTTFHRDMASLAGVSYGGVERR